MSELGERERKQRALDWTPAPSHLQKERYVHTCILTYVHLYMHTTVSRISVRGAFFRCLLSGPSDSSPRSKRQRRLSLVCSRHADMLVCLLPPPACAPALEVPVAGGTGERRAPRSRARPTSLFSGHHAAVAQLARASACHAEGRGFESLHPLRTEGPALAGPSSFQGRVANASPSLQRRGVDRQLGGEGPLVGGPCLAAGDVGGEVRELVQKA